MRICYKVEVGSMLELKGPEILSKERESSGMNDPLEGPACFIISKW